MTDLLNVHCDTNERMRIAFERLDEVWDEITKDHVRILMQTAFWAGVESVSDKSFVRAVREIAKERDERE